jgi:hypothetical protein
MTIGNMNYSGSCQDVGYNGSGQNTLVNCTSGSLSAPECSINNKNDGTIKVTCGGSQYIFSCNSGVYLGNWYQISINSYKCVN